MIALEPTRFDAPLAAMRERCAALPADRLADLDAAMDIDTGEHFAFQTEQSRAFAAGKLTFGEAQFIYAALGEIPASGNGGWQPHIDTAAKCLITQVITELVSKRMGVRL